jgi:hypothetical protein
VKTLILAHATLKLNPYFFSNSIDIKPYKLKSEYWQVLYLKVQNNYTIKWLLTFKNALVILNKILFLSPSQTNPIVANAFIIIAISPLKNHING